MAHTILVVDDHSTSRECTATLLRASGYQVLRASNAKDALELLSSCRTDLALLDVLMPEMDGLELLAILQTHPDHCTLPVILITGDPDPQLASQARQLGAQDFLIKSRFTPQQLLKLVSHHVSTPASM